MYNDELKKIFLVALALVAGWYFFLYKPAIKNIGKPVSVIVAFGDDITAGEGAGNDPRNTYPALLAQLTGKRVINEGYSGETAANAPRHLNKVLAYNPQMVIIQFGDNDFLQNLPVSQSAQSMGQMIDAVQEAGAVAVVVVTGGRGTGPYSRAFKKLAHKKGAIFIPSVLSKVLNKKEYLADDKKHPNFRGYRLVSEKIHMGIEPYLHY